jgi:ketose-bisphosphate aldolase
MGHKLIKVQHAFSFNEIYSQQRAGRDFPASPTVKKNMPLISMKELLAGARAGGYSLCYCESWNLESLQAVIEAAEELRSPVVAGFNGGFLMHPERSRPERLVYYGCLAAAVRASSAPIAFLLNETDDLAQMEEGIRAGFNSVMVENACLGLNEYRQRVKEVVSMARANHVSVEAQIGHLPNGWDNGNGGEVTDPEGARAFVEQTGIDALGVSIGNVHILTRGTAKINLDSLREIHRVVDIPLVIHGGTGFPAEHAGEAIALGVAKFNFGTNLKQAWLAAVRQALAAYAEPMSPHPFLGIGGDKDIMVAGRNAVKQKAKELILAYGYAGRPRPAAVNPDRNSVRECVK